MRPARLRVFSAIRPGTVALALLGALAAAALAAASACAGDKAADKAADKAGAREFQVPRPVTRTLANGLVVHVFEDHRLPRVYYRMLVRAGSLDEAAAQAGMAALTAAVMRQGTETLGAQELSAKIDFVGGNLSLSAERDYAVAQAQARTPDRDLALALLADVVLHPAFAADEVERMRSQTQAAIRQSRDDPGTVADEHLVALIHGPHPYARPAVGDEQSVGGLRREDLVAFHRTYWRPNNAALAVAGDVRPEEVFAAVEQAFGGWEQAAVPPPAEVRSPELAASRVRLLDKPDLTQSQIRVGYLGLPRATPDYHAVQVMNYILGGGGFSSRLVAEVRAKAGLTYDADTRWVFGLDPGTFALSTFTKNESVKAMIDAALDVLRRFRDEGPTADELAKAKAFYLGAFPFGFQTPGDIAEQWLRAQFHRLGDDYFDRYRERIRAVTADDVKRVAQAYLRTEPVAVVVVGKGEEVAPQLAGFGEVESLSFTDRTGAIPEVAQALPSSLAPATPESRRRAAALVEKALRAHGGTAAFKAVRDWHTRGTVTVSMGQMSLDGDVAEYVQLPSRRRMEMTVMDQPMVQVMDGDVAWTVAGGNVGQMEPEQVEAMRTGALTNLLRLLPALAEPGADIRYAGRHDLAGKTREVVEWVRPAGKPAEIYLDADTGELVGLEEPELAPTGGGWVPVQRVYGDYRVVGKIKIPHTVTVYSRGVKMVETRLSVVEVNRGVSAALFRQPQR